MSKINFLKPDKDKVRAINSGGKLTPPSYMKEVVANCFKTGTSNEIPTF